MLKSSATPATPHTPPIKYPCLMMHNASGNLVLFWERGVGTLVQENTAHRNTIGYYSESWRMSEFVPFYGSVTITQTEE